MREIEEKLFFLRDPSYRAFQAKLMPGYDRAKIIGVRTPALRAFAKELGKSALADEFLREMPHKYYEENNLHAFLIPHLATDFDEAQALTEAFLPYVDNWATCDSFRVKQFKTNLSRLYALTEKWVRSDRTYTVRYGVVTRLNEFLDDAFDPEMLDDMAKLQRDDYYINMAIAWYYSFALIKQYDAAIPLFTERKLTPWIHNKALQKAIESYRIDKETKDWLRSLKIK